MKNFVHVQLVLRLLQQPGHGLFLIHNLGDRDWDTALQALGLHSQLDAVLFRDALGSLCLNQVGAHFLVRELGPLSRGGGSKRRHLGVNGSWLPLGWSSENIVSVQGADVGITVV